MVDGSLRVTPASSTTKTGRHDKAEILLKSIYRDMIVWIYHMDYQKP